jgi:hypothetical protein
MATRFGFDALNKALTSGLRGNFITKLAMGTEGLIIQARVKSVVLDSTHPRFLELGEWNGLGTIEFTSVTQPTNGKQTTTNATARPVFSNIKVYPLENELVYLIALPTTEIGTDTNSTSYYYINSIALWNHPHHNAYPVDATEVPEEQRKDYIQTSLGSVRRVTDGSTEISLGKTFQEQSNIHPILPYEGDVLVEGRFGNSIRLGSTVVSKETNQGQNNWSEGPLFPGDPITIIRNGQPTDASDEGWTPIVEDINKDQSSIYLTSTQKINIQPSSTNDIAYDTPPKKPNEYYGTPQILLNSDRIYLNTRKDNILLSSGGLIGLLAQSSVNISGKNTIILDSPNIRLGSKTAKEPLLKGQQTVDLLKKLLENLNEFMKVCQTQAVPLPNQKSVPLTKINQASQQMEGVLVGLLQQLDDLKSKSNFTI